MFKLKTPFCLFLLGFLLLCINCRKNDCSKKAPIQVLIPQEVLDYVDFKAGTYWVYQDSTTGRIDSEVVVSSKHTMENISMTNQCGEVVVTKQIENIEMIIQRFDSLGDKKEAWIREFNNSRKETSNNFDDIFIIDHNQASFLIGYPFNGTYSMPSYTIHEHQQDSFLINGRIFKEILIIQEDYDGLPPGQKMMLVYSKHIGLIKNMEYFTGQNNGIRYLLRYKIF